MHSRLEEYLQTVEQNLQHLPAYERQNELNEIRMHLDSLVQANTELGDTEEEAVTETLAQFGRAQTLGKDLTLVHQSAGKPTFQDLAAAAAFNYVGGSVAMLAVSRLVILPLAYDGVPTFFWMVRSLLTMFCIDWLTGAVMPRGAVKGAFYARLLGAVLSLVFTLGLQPTTMPMVSVWSIGGSLAISSLIQIGLAVVGAKSGAQWRVRRDKKLRLAG